MFLKCSVWARMKSASRSPLRHLVQPLTGWCLNGPFGPSLLCFSSVFALCSYFNLSPGCSSCSVFSFPSLTSLPGSPSSLTRWAALEVGVIFPARANLTLCAAVRTKSRSAVASAVHLQPFNPKYCKEAMWLPPFSPPPPPVTLWLLAHWLQLTPVTVIFMTDRWRDCSSAIQMPLVLMRRQCG